jgi:hypothetical protein
VWRRVSCQQPLSRSEPALSLGVSLSKGNVSGERAQGGAQGDSFGFPCSFPGFLTSARRMAGRSQSPWHFAHPGKRAALIFLTGEVDEAVPPRFFCLKGGGPAGPLPFPRCGKGRGARRALPWSPEHIQACPSSLPRRACDTDGCDQRVSPSGGFLRPLPLCSWDRCNYAISCPSMAQIGSGKRVERSAW